MFMFSGFNRLSGPRERNARHFVASDSSIYDWITLIFFALVAAAVFPLTESLNGKQDADGILTSLISTQRLTWYFWGQDRFLNLLPALAKPFADVEFNLNFQIGMRAMCAYLAPMGILCMLGANLRQVALATALANAALALSASEYLKFNFYVQHTPYATSLVLFMLAFYVGKRDKIALYILSACILILAYATNISLIFVSPFLVLAALLSGTSSVRILKAFAFSNIFAFVFAYLHSRLLPNPTTPVSIDLKFDHVYRGALAIKENFHLPALFVFLVIALLFFFAARRKDDLACIVLVISAFLVAVLVSVLSWTQANRYNIRYYIPSITIGMSVAAYAITSRINTDRFGRYFYPVAIAGLISIILIFGFNGVEKKLQPVGAPWRYSEPLANIAVEHKIELIVGDFWSAWPLVYEANKRFQALGANHPEVYGVAYRGELLRSKVIEKFEARQGVKTLCAYSSAKDCNVALQKFIDQAGKCRTLFFKESDLAVEGRVAFLGFASIACLP